MFIQRKLTATILLLLVDVCACAQQYDLLLKNGHVIDPKNNLDAIMDIAISKENIAKVDKSIAVSSAKKVVDVSGLYVIPGMIDMHTHVFVGNKAGQFADGIYSVSPDDFSFRSGITTVVDAGTSGWQNFALFKSQVIDHSQTRILAFINVFGQGLATGQAVKDTTGLNTNATISIMQQYKNIIVGTRIGHYDGTDWRPFDAAIEIAASMNAPVLIECHLPQYSLQDQLNKMRSGDIITHSYEEISERLPVTDSSNHIRDFVLQAQQRGVLFDVGHGGAGFWFSQAIPAFKQGLAPNTFGTDLHRFSMNAGMKSMLNVASKYLNIGMSLNDVVIRATWNAAKALHHEELGNLGEGGIADIAVISLQKGNFGFIDAAGKRLSGNQKLEAELTIRGGKIVWDLNGLAAQPYKE